MPYSPDSERTVLYVPFGELTMIGTHGVRHAVPLDTLRGTDLAIAGGKGANLGELVRAGYPVPAGFVVPTAAYVAAVRSNGLGDLIARCLTGSDGAGAVRDAFARSLLPDSVRVAITQAYAELGGGPVAVRSSATAEDLPGAAFAGQQDTYLGVEGEEEVLDAVRDCWGSLWTDRAVLYRQRLGIGHEDVAIAVVVQRMVDAEFAGVMFTADPLTGERSHVVVDAAAGLGESVVSGTVTPHHIVVDARGRIRSRRQGQGAVVPDGVVTDLAATGRAVAAHFGRPQDIEWAHAAGRTWLLQARPMTALPPQPIRLSRLQRFTASIQTDYLQVRPYPLDVTAWLRPEVGRMVERLLAEIPGLRTDFGATLHEEDGVVDRFIPVTPRPTLAVLGAPMRIMRKARRFHPAVWMSDPRFTRFEEEVAELDALDVTRLEWKQLLQVRDRIHTASESIVGCRVDYLPAAVTALVKLAAVLGLLGLTDLFPMLITGSRTRTDDANEALEDLAGLVRADPRLREVVTSTERDLLQARLEEDPGFAGFRAALGEFTAEYGHRETTSLFLVSAPTWGEDLATVLALIQVLVDEPREKAAQKPARAEEALVGHPVIRATGTGDAVLRLIRSVREGITFREDTHFHASRVVPALRRTVLEAGRRLVDARVLDDSDGIFHLRFEELEEITDPAGLTCDGVRALRELVRRRAAKRDELAGVPLISPASLVGAPHGDEDVLVSGVPTGAGRVTGRVRIVHGPEEFATLRGGEVLVCPYTNPAWTPLFQRAAAVVVDSGGMASHAAIIAREYGIPAVMGTVLGTAVLTQGETVIVDGSTGRVMRA
jgi:phosphohistidine swiveling domain-containing protein